MFPWITKVDAPGQKIAAAHINDLQDKKLDAYDAGAYASFAAAVAAIGATVAPLNVTAASTLAANVTTPATMNLIIHKGAPITIPNGITLTINGQPTIGLYQAFICTGTGKVVFGAGAVVEVHPEWWGAKGDDTTDCTTAIKASIASLPAGKVLFGAGGYVVTDTITLKSGIVIKGCNEAIQSWGAWCDSNPITYIDFNPASEKDLFYITPLGAPVYASNVGICDIGLLGNTEGAVTFSRYALNLNFLCQSVFRNVGIEHFQRGHCADAAMLNKYENVFIARCSLSCFYYDYSTTSSTSDVWDACFFHDSTLGGTIKVGYDIRFDSCLFEGLDNGVDIYSACREITFTNSYAETTPNTANGYVFRLGADGGTVSLGNNLTINGGIFFGSGVATAGSFLEVDHCTAARIIGGTMWGFDYGIKCLDAAATPDNAIYLSDPNWTDCDTNYSNCAGKIWGQYLDEATATTKTTSHEAEFKYGPVTIGPDNAHGWAKPFHALTGHVAFASTGTWRTVATITFAATDYGGGYLMFSYGGVEAATGAASAVLVGTFLKDGAGNPSFASISNVVANCTVQAAADGATKLVVQMKSSAGANAITGNFSFLVMGSAITTMTVTAPGYSD